MPLPIPKFIKTAFANIGLRNNIPEITNNTTGAAGYDRGFGEINMLPEGAGGIPPDGKDFNGILFDISSAIRYLQSGVTFPFDQDFADAIGGYRVKAIVADPVDPTILWQNNNANNTLPPSVPNGWTQVFSAAELLRDPTSSLRGAPFQASQAQAEGGSNNVSMMTALRVHQAIAKTTIGSDSQAYENVKPSRALGVTYTNTSGRAIFIVLSLSLPATVSEAILTINGFQLKFGKSGGGTSAQPGIGFLIQNGSTYSASAVNGSISEWLELR